ncbi:MAG: class I SAM-dependent methyltransferase [Spirochaetes bacterium]|nr:class I SAM-dependent methyltransferase [Spirochaetota bacterium]
MTKADAAGKIYNIYACSNCTVWHLHPLPSTSELTELYQSTYFKERSDRGYADYTSEKIYRSVVSTLAKNLRDLDFFSWEQNLRDKKLLEVGCAAGHAVAFFADRGWQSLGIDIAREMVVAGQHIGRNLLCADFLRHDFENQKFNLITHWATLEHLPDAEAFLRKMVQYLEPDGRIYLSTCNTGYFARRKGAAWRYLNVPEHVFYFNKKSLAELAARCGLEIIRSFSYGSGFTTRENTSWWYRCKKRIGDRLAHFFLTGDMIVVELRSRANPKTR